VKDNKKAASESYVYQAPPLFVGIFYLLLAAWVVFCVVFLESVFSRLGLSVLFGLIMIAFIIFYMCYFALALSYKIEVWNDGRIRLTSLRKIFNALAEDIPYIEEPHLPLGFIRFRLEREKGYLFSVTSDASLKKVLSIIRAANPDIRFKKLGLWQKKK
jgi:hypothetical protein